MFCQGSKLLLRKIAPLLLLALLISGAGVSMAQEGLVRIFRPDGTLQCGMGRERTLSEDQETLQKLGGGKIAGAEKRVIPVLIPAVCGAPTGRVNTYLISREAWIFMTKGFVGPAGFALWIYDGQTVVVYKYDGTLQCGGGKEISLETMATELKDAGIRIISQRKATDGLMHIQLCNSSTGAVNAYEIASSDLHKAMSLGFAYLMGPETAKSLLSQGEASLLGGAAAPTAAGSLPLPWPFPW
jgi:hypothetical protein